MERRISNQPSLPEIRLHCLDMAVRGATLTGRTDSLMTIADQYFSWVMRGAKPQAPTTQTPSAPRGGTDDEEDEPISSAPTPSAPPPSSSVPASLRQPGGNSGRT